MTITIPDEILECAHISETEFLQEIALTLFQKNRLSLAQASKLAKMDRVAFQHLLASRQIPIHYDTAEFEADLRTFREVNP